PASASRRKPMICSSEKRFFTSNLLRMGDWTPNRCATQRRGDVGDKKTQRRDIKHAAKLAKEV
ncbi:hypothetical protein, partial [Frateuria sp. STR12]|uniref:hypothetical protein n=1 Tax=Frateuria hangzhouensis TaxID=2995589 RepID=UPI002260DBB4